MSTQETSYRVVGMSCDHCVRAVTAAVSNVAGVRDVQVDLESGALTVTSDQGVDGPAVVAAVEEAGYEVAS
mgnify:CR=1 FL=1